MPFSKAARVAARAQNVWLCIIPASMTGVLQPLDTHVCARFRRFLRTRLHHLMLSDTNTDLTADEVLDALMHSMKGALQRTEWASVFETSGFRTRVEVRPHQLQLPERTLPPVIPADLPSLAQFQCCFPAGRCIPFQALLCRLLLLRAASSEARPRHSDAGARRCW